MIRRAVAASLLAATTATPAAPPAGAAPEPLLGYAAESSAAQRALEARFDAELDAKRMIASLERLAARPHHLGSAWGKANAEWMRDQLASWGFEARLEEYSVLFPTPKVRVLEMTSPTHFKASLTEPALKEDRTSGQTAEQLPPYNAFSADGDVEAEIVYVNYGVPKDYEELAKRGVSVKGKIALSRYGGSWRGIKPKVAAENGAIGCVIFSDPADDGYRQGDVYPKDGWRSSDSVQRGSVADMPVHPGDPLTPGVAATRDAKRLERKDAVTITKIPVLPISYGDALPLLKALGGPMAPEAWRGGLPIPYRLGPGPAKVHLKVEFAWKLTPLFDVVAVLRGSERPDEWVLRGNHHDAWVNGANDPVSGMAALLEEARAIGQLSKGGWRPKRTLVYAGWDGEEQGLLGSTEFVEAHAAELREKAVAYINTDSNGRGFVSIAGSHTLEKLVNGVARDVEDPERGVSILERARARALTAGEKEARKEARDRADVRLGALGAGSDYTPFIQHLGVAALHVGFGGEEHYGQYHSAYDTIDHFERFVDPGMRYGVVSAKTTGRMALRIANADTLPFQFGALADSVAKYAGEVEKLADDMREETAETNRLLEEKRFENAADPNETFVAPAPKQPVPHLNFAPLKNAVAKLKESAERFDRLPRTQLASASRRELDRKLMAMERALTLPEGLPGRPWYVHQVYAPGRYTGYGVKTLPAVREAIELREWAEAEKQIVVVSGVIERYAKEIDAAAALIPTAGGASTAGKGSAVETLVHDLKYALRSLRKSPGFTAAAVLLLALGIGANTAIFSVTSALLLRPLPYRDPARLAILWNRSPGLGITQDWFSTAQYFDIKSSHTGFEQLAIAIGGNDNLSGEGGPAERVGVIRVSSNLLPMLGAVPPAGRLFTAAEDVEGGPAVAVLGHGLWARRYGEDPGVVGRSILLNGKPHQVIGVLPRSFGLPREVLPTLNGAERADILLPLPMGAEAATFRGREDYNVLGRLKPGVTVKEAQVRMDAITARLRQDFPEVYPPNGGLTFGIVPLQEQVVGETRRPLLLLQGAVGFVLLIACVNVANLLLSRAVSRQREMAVKSAIGAGAARLVRQLLTESALLGLLGGALGLGMALAGVRALRVLGTRSVPRLGEISVDGAALAFTLLVSIASGVLFGLAPALRATRFDFAGTLKGADTGSSSLFGRGHTLRRLLVVAELALSLVLLVGAGLLLRSFGLVKDVQPGFDPRGVLTVELAASGDRYKEPVAVRETYRRLWERLEALPGVEAAGGITSLPFAELAAWGPITVEGRLPLPGERFINVDQRVVSGHYFRAMRIPLLKGRFFDPDADTPEKPRAVIIDDHMAQQLWPAQDPVGKRISFGDLSAERSWATVIGVVGTVKQDALDADSRIALYMSQSQAVGRTLCVVIRSADSALDGGGPAGSTAAADAPSFAALSAAVRRELDAIDRDLPMHRVASMETRVQESLARRRFTTFLLGLFAALALVLAAIGIYGVMAYLVRQGTREIGIRMALGATRRGVVALVVRQGMSLALAGVSLGLLASLALSRLLTGLLFGVTPHDPRTFFGIAALLSAVALLATAIPAGRAARVQPMTALRCD